MACTEAVVRKYSSKEVFLKISHISQENTCVGVSFQQSCRPEGLLLKLQHWCFHVKFAKYLMEFIFKEIAIEI